MALMKYMLRMCDGRIKLLSIFPYSIHDELIEAIGSDTNTAFRIKHTINNSLSQCIYQNSYFYTSEYVNAIEDMVFKNLHEKGSRRFYYRKVASDLDSIKDTVRSLMYQSSDLSEVERLELTKLLSEVRKLYVTVNNSNLLNEKVISKNK